MAAILLQYPLPTVAALTILGTTSAYFVLGHLLKRLAYARFTVLGNLKDFGRARSSDAAIAERVVICGGSVVGLLAARVCADYFDEVVVIDPEAHALVERALADDAYTRLAPRLRVMQTEAYHSTFGMYYCGLRRLFPDIIQAELEYAGALIGSIEANMHMGGVHVRMPVEHFPTELRKKIGLSRAGHETLVRRLVAKSCKNIRFVSGTVSSLDPDVTDGTKLRSVRFRSAKDAKVEESIDAALVIDASGMAQAGVKWLQRAGYQLPPADDLIEGYEPHIRYTTVFVKIDPAKIAALYPAHLCADAPIMGLFVPAAFLGERRILAIKRIEGHRLSILTCQPGFDAKINCVQDLREYVESIQQIKPAEPWIFTLLDYISTLPEENIAFVRGAITPLRRVKYHQHGKKLPSNYVAIGDACMRLNPIYGQGLSKAMMELITLDAGLRRTSSGSGALPADFAASYFSRVNNVTAAVWNGNKSRDYNLDTCEPARGETRESGAGMRWYSGRVGRRIMRGDQDMLRRMFLVNSFIGPPTELMSLSVLARVAMDIIMGR